MASVQKQAHTRYLIACFRDKDGHQKRRSTKCMDRRRAQKIAEGYEAVFTARDTVAHVRKTLRELTIDLGGAEAVMTLKDYLNFWFERKRSSLAAESVTSYRQKLDAFAAFLAGVAPADLPRPLTALARVPAHALAAGIAPWMMTLFRWRDAQP